MLSIEQVVLVRDVARGAVGLGDLVQRDGFIDLSSALRAGEGDGLDGVGIGRGRELQGSQGHERQNAQTETRCDLFGFHIDLLQARVVAAMTSGAWGSLTAGLPHRFHHASSQEVMQSPRSLEGSHRTSRLSRRKTAP